MSHAATTSATRRRGSAVIVPMHRQLARGPLRSILRRE